MTLPWMARIRFDWIQIPEFVCVKMSKRLMMTSWVDFVIDLDVRSLMKQLL
jgi:hypothetical protein